MIILLFMNKLTLPHCRALASCQSTCSWSATQQRSSTSPAIPASTVLASATAPTTLVSSSTRRPGHVDGAPQTSRVKLPFRWVPATLLSSNVLTMIRCPLRPAEGRLVTYQLLKSHRGIDKRLEFKIQGWYLTVSLHHYDRGQVIWKPVIFSKLLFVFTFFFFIRSEKILGSLLLYQTRLQNLQILEETIHGHCATASVKISKTFKYFFFIFMFRRSSIDYFELYFYCTCAFYFPVPHSCFFASFCDLNECVMF